MIHLIEEIVAWWRHRRRGHGISFLVPFHCPDPNHQRSKNWHWLKKYWECQFPGAEIIMGVDPVSACDPSIPFSKSAAVNDAASRARGDIFVIIDADGFLEAESVILCVKRIRRARERGHRLWFIPYRQFYRLTPRASRRLIDSNPCDPYFFPTPPLPCDIQNTSGSQHGHWFGAGVQILPREAFCEVGGWDERFRGWGGEDHSAMRATDTLYWPHKTLPGQFLHIWHPMLGPEGSELWVDWKYRMWANQTTIGNNDELTARYYGAHMHPKRMRRLVEEGRR